MEMNSQKASPLLNWTLSVDGRDRTIIMVSGSCGHQLVSFFSKLLTIGSFLLLDAAGNRRLRSVISENVSRYEGARSKTEKGHIIADIVDNLKRESPSGIGFVKLNPRTGRWSFIGTEKAKDKIGHALRKASSNASKKKKKLGASASVEGSHFQSSLAPDDPKRSLRDTLPATMPSSDAPKQSVHSASSLHSRMNISSGNGQASHTVKNGLLTPNKGKQKRQQEVLGINTHFNGNVDVSSFPLSVDTDPPLPPTHSPYYGYNQAGSFYETLNAAGGQTRHPMATVDGHSGEGASPPSTPVNRNVFSESHQEIHHAQTPDLSVLGSLEPSPLRDQAQHGTASTSEADHPPPHFPPLPPYYYYPPLPHPFPYPIMAGQPAVAYYPPPPPGYYPHSPAVHHRLPQGRLAPRRSGHSTSQEASVPAPYALQNGKNMTSNGENGHAS